MVILQTSDEHFRTFLLLAVIIRTFRINLENEETQLKSIIIKHLTEFQTDGKLHEEYNKQR